MPKIYSQAKEVMVWLGDNADDLDGLEETLIDAKNALVGAFRLSKQDGRDFKEFIFDYSVQLANEGQPSLFTLNWDPIVCLLINRAWFQRKWVVQELTRARQATLICGDTLEIEWGWLAFIITCAHRVQVLGSYTLTSPKTQRAIDNFMTLFTAQERYGHIEIPLLNVMSLTRNFLCSDLRDHIFAILSLASDTDPTEGQKYPLQPDYHAQAAEVFIRFALNEIFDKRNLSVLSLAGKTGGGGQVQVPSWVPDLSAGTSSHSLQILSAFNFRAGGHDMPVVSVDESLMALSCRAKILGNVVDLAPCLGEMLEAIFPPVDSFAKATADDVVRWTSISGEFFKTCTRVVQRHGQFLADGMLAKWLCCGLDYTTERLETGWAERQATYEALMSEEALGSVLENGRAAANLDAALYTFAVRRKLCVRDNGQLGMTPILTRVGDKLCVIFGARVPYVIRPVEDSSSYQLIGECYLEGVMDGEAMQMDGFEEVEIAIE